jgi:hypothetical protein
MMLIRRKHLRVEIEQQTLRVSREFVESTDGEGREGLVPGLSLEAGETAALAGWIQVVHDGKEEGR